MSNDNKNALLHILSTNSSFQIPRVRFERYLEEILPRGKKARPEVDKYKKEYFIPRQEVLKKITLEISPLSIGLYNATVDTKQSIDIKKILDVVKKDGLVSEGGIKVTEFTIRYGKFQTALSYTSEYGLVGDESKPFVSADFQIKITKGGETKGASFSYYKSGKIRFSGGHLDNLKTQPKELLNFFSKHYYNIPSSSIVNLNNVTSEFKVGFPLKTSLIFDVFSDPDVESRFDGMRVVAKYNEKKFLYLTFEKEFSIIIADTGVVQIQGTTEIDDAYKVLKKFFEALKNNDFLKISGSQNAILKKPKKTKITRRLDNLPAPNITRRGTTCPKGRRPDPYSYEGKCTQTGCYIKPNPQGQPCCYTVPKSVEYSKNKVDDAYRKAGVKVPLNVRKLFGFGHQTNNRPINVAKKNTTLNVRAYVNNKKGFKIDTRQCLRYTKVALVDMATRLKIVLPTKLTKPILCDLIKNASKLPNVNVKASDKIITGSNKTLRLGSRMCHTYPRETLAKFARALGGVVPTTLEKGDICKLIEQLSTNKRKKLQENFDNRQKAENQKIKKVVENPHNKKARLTRNLVKEDLMGLLELSSVNNRNVDSLMNTISKAIKNGTIRKDKSGNPRKKNVDKVKTAFATKMIENEENTNFNYFMRGPKSKTS